MAGSDLCPPLKTPPWVHQVIRKKPKHENFRWISGFWGYQVLGIECINCSIFFVGAGETNSMTLQDGPFTCYKWA